MRVLFVLANCSYPPREGAHDQTLRLIKALSRDGVECAVLVGHKGKSSFSADELKLSAPGINILGMAVQSGSYTFSLARNMLLRLVLQLAGVLHIQRLMLLSRLTDFYLVSEGARFAASFDIVHVEGIQLAPLLSRIGTEQVVFSCVDAWSLRQKRLMGRSRRIPMKVARAISYAVALAGERFFLRRHPQVHVVSHVDAEYLRQKQQISSAFSIPVALPDEFLVGPSLGTVRQGITIFGDIGVPHIYDGVVEFLSEYFSRYAGQPHSRKVTVLGRSRPTGVLEEMADRLSDHLTFVDWVPDIASAMYSSEIVVLPDMTGTGLKNRGVAALASGAAVVGTPSAFEGLDVVHRDHGIVGETPRDLAREVFELLMRPSEMRALGQAGRQFALHNYSTSRVVALWRERYSAAFAGRSIAEGESN